MPESANALLATGFGYAPMATGHQHTRKFPTEGLPFMNGTFGGFAAMGATPFLNRGMGEVGMTPMGLGHDQNVYDRMMNQRFTMMQMQAMTTAAQSDRDNYMKTFRGLAAVTGTPYGSEQRRAAQALSNAATNMSPIMADMMPEFLDQMGGSRGSATVMSRRMIDAGRYRIDPLTGRMGMSGESVGAISNNLYGSMFSDDNIHRMRGVTAGQAGALFGELQMRGMVGTAASEGRYMGIRADDPRAATMRAVEDMRRSSPDALSRAFKATQVDATKPGGLNAGDLDKLMTSPEVGDKIRSFDATRIKSSIQSYVKVVSAMRDIFGDMGKPNAPMAELVAGVEALTMGGMGRLDPGRMSMMVRQTYNLAKQTGVTMDNVMQMQAHAAQRAGQMGIEPGFAVQATQGGLAFGGAYRAQGHAAHGAWGAMSSDQVTQLDTNLRVQAASSNLANRMAVATRLSETSGGFDPNSAAGRYTAAVKAGQSDFIGEDGRVRSVMIGDRDFTKLMTGAGKNISEGDVQSMLGQRDTNREYVERYGMANTIRRVQGTEEVHPFVGHRMEQTLTARFRDQLMRSGMSQDEAQRRATEVSSRIGQTVTRRMFDMGTEEFADTNSRNAGISGFIQEELDNNGMNDVLKGMDPNQRQQFLAQTADQFYGAGNRAIRGSIYRSFGNLQNVHRLTNKSTLDESDRQQMEAKFKAQMQDAMSPLGHGSMLQRAVDALQDMRPDDPQGAMGVVASALGGVRIEDINRTLMPHFDKVNEQRRAVEKLQGEVMKTSDPVAKAKLMEQLEVARRQLTGQAEGLAKTGEQFGLFTKDSLGHADLTKAFSSTRSVMTMQNDITGVRGNFGGDVSDSEIRGFRAANVVAQNDTELLALAEARSMASGAGPLDRSKFDPSKVDGKVATDDEARAMIRTRRRMVAYRPNQSQVEEIKKLYPGLTDGQATEMATNRLRASRLGVEIQAKYASADEETAAIANKFAAEADKMFDVSDTDIADLKKTTGYRDPTADEIKRYRDVNEVDGKVDDAGVIKQMQTKMVVKGRQAAYNARFNKLWGSTQGAAARDSVDFATQDVATVADKLISSPQMVQRLGTRAIELSDSLKGDQQRLRELALYHSEGDVAKLMAGHYTGEFTKEGAAKIRDEVTSIQMRQRSILAELAGTEGLPGRQFHLGDETNARKRVLDEEVRAGRMKQEDADKIIAATPNSAQLLKIGDMQRELGSEERARAIRGIPIGKRNLTESDRAGIAGVRFGAGSDDEVKLMYGLDRWDKLSPTEQAAAAEKMREGTKGNTEDAMKLLGITDAMLKKDVNGDLARKIDATKVGLQTDAHAMQLANVTKEMMDAATPDEKKAYEAKIRSVRGGLYNPALAREKLGIAPDGMSETLLAKVRASREAVGNEAEAMRLMGKKPGDPLTADETEKLRKLTYDVGVARKISPEDESTIISYESKLSRLDKMASSRGLTVADIEKKGDALVLTGDERGRLDVARRDFNAADRSVNILATREKNVQAMLDSLKDDMSEAGGKRRERLKEELSGIQGDLKKYTETRGRAETSVDADAKRRGVTSADYIRGKGWIDAEGLKHFRSVTGERDADKKKIDEMAAILKIKPEDLAGATGVSRRLLDAQGNALKKDSKDPKDIVRNIMAEFGVGKLDGPETDEGKAMAQLMEGNAGRGMGMRMLETQRTMKDRASRGGKSTDEMAAAYFKAAKSGKEEDMTAFRETYKMLDKDGHGQVTGKSNREFADFQQAIQFQQQTGILGFGVEGRNKARTQGDLARLYAQAMQGGEMKGPDGKPGGSQQPSKMEMTGTVTLKGDQLDMAGVHGRSFIPGGW